MSEKWKDVEQDLDNAHAVAIVRFGKRIGIVLTVLLVVAVAFFGIQHHNREEAIKKDVQALAPVFHEGLEAIWADHPGDWSMLEVMAHRRKNDPKSHCIGHDMVDYPYEKMRERLVALAAHFDYDSLIANEIRTFDHRLIGRDQHLGYAVIDFSLVLNHLQDKYDLPSPVRSFTWKIGITQHTPQTGCYTRDNT
jgi:hypothetical protein